ncbi:hypothetical protein HYX58_04955 [Candidatus Dependentiae bacterium]|nr:hypothetical protein [Candidatus Dependentiae bacterium]
MQKLICVLALSFFVSPLRSMNTEQVCDLPHDNAQLLVNMLCAAMPLSKLNQQDKEKENIVRITDETAIESERISYINEFNKLSLSERTEHIKRGAVFNRTPSLLMHSAFAKLSPKELNRYFKKIDFPDDLT